MCMGDDPSSLGIEGQRHSQDQGLGLGLTEVVRFIVMSLAVR